MITEKQSFDYQLRRYVDQPFHFRNVLNKQKSGVNSPTKENTYHHNGDFKRNIQ